ncbi:endonuclease III [Reyranella sp. CPCC 100927]|uniref:endonuclease III domain-containing protein n=1 Tax=Reyranella sp. CPCC 100927 TaxID=2599616 RepID=UPI0011B8017E|nr:hypothetical protein [Reyranella sp. CPCC 100927]TWT05960.1 hypothetical protein FQU96_23180 [Reyranella sp. CPCC 100927]
MIPASQLAFSFDHHALEARSSRPPHERAAGPRSPLVLIRRRLLALYGPQRPIERPDPIDQLINAILSTKTRDEVSFPAFRRLLYRYKSWTAVIDAPIAEIARTIRAVTHHERKAEYIPGALHTIVAQTGSLDLMFLQGWPEDTAMAWLMTLPGAGPKVAATTLNWSLLRKRVLAVDTHLLRVGQRLGLVPANADYNSGFEAFMRLVPADWDADDLFEFHWLMKLHSQRICAYEHPACFRCPLRDHCPHNATRH